jgi:beta-aspartyl-peptidase (threonine type)
MERSPHVLLAYEGADRFALQQGLEQAEAAYFFTPARWGDLLEWREEHRLAAPRSDGLGTVGAVARDCHGNLAAATSTGGTTGQARGRVGDTPLIGAGTYARNGECAVSATGAGEYLIRATAARQLCDRVKWAGETLAEAAQSVIDDVKRLGGNGGLIAMTAEGEIAFGLRDFGMYRGIISSCVPARTAVFSDERIAFAP